MEMRCNFKQVLHRVCLLYQTDRTDIMKDSEKETLLQAEKERGKQYENRIHWPWHYGKAHEQKLNKSWILPDR